MASGETLLIFTPLQNVPPASNPATLDMRNNHPVLEFDDTTNESAVFTDVLPENYDGGGITVEIWVMGDGITSGDFDVDVAIERILAATTDLDSDSFDTAQSSDNNTVDSIDGVPIKISVNLSNAQIDGLQAGEPFRMKIERDAANDTGAADMQLLVVHVVEQ